MVLSGKVERVGLLIIIVLAILFASFAAAAKLLHRVKTRLTAYSQIENAAHVAGVVFWAALVALMVALLLHPTGWRQLSGVNGSAVFEVLAAIFALL